MMAMNEYFFHLGTFSIKDGLEIQFWEDRWLGNTTLQKLYLALYSIVHYKSDTIDKVMETSPPNVMFRRNFSGHAYIMEFLTSTFG
jgi:hypothetical protein